jgi:hypothetical protein
MHRSYSLRSVQKPKLLNHSSGSDCNDSKRRFIVNAILELVDGTKVQCPRRSESMRTPDLHQADHNSELQF